jgi:tRNA (mo5U34)-methyltransferase
MQIFGAETGAIQRRIENLKQQHPSPGFEWYRYNSFNNLVHLKELLAGSEPSVLEVARQKGVLDVGCGDGDLSFLFEVLGCRVDAMDHSIPNHNHMRGVRYLAKELHSSVGIHEVDLDTQFAVPQERYGLTLLLGVLYHLKNPLYALEHLAKHSDYCVFSTRVARRLPNGGGSMEGQPLAYLLDPDELNQDNSNYWIFSNTGLRRILTRAKWGVLGWLNLGDTTESDPVSIKHDERVFGLLKSHHNLSHVDLMEGWHSAENGGWRWTEKRFSACFQIGEGERRTRLVLQAYLPQEMFEQLGPVTLRIRMNGSELEPGTLQKAGPHVVIRPVESLRGGVLLVEFELNKALEAKSTSDGREERELGIIVASLELE